MIIKGSLTKFIAVITIALALFQCSNDLFTSQDDSSNYNDIIKLLKRNNYSGSIYIKYRDKEPFTQSFGMRNDTVKNDNQSMYLIGSANKFVTAMLIKHLELERKLNVNDNIKKYFPEYPDNNTTILDLLLHKSGLREYVPINQPLSLEQTTNRIIKNGITKAHYHKYKYNDVNYIMLARLSEIITGKSYTENLNHYILKRNHLNHTSLYDNSINLKFMAIGQTYHHGQLTTEQPIYLDQYVGAGSLYMSAEDMGTLVNNFVNYKLFDKNTTDQLLNFKTYQQKYRYGFHIMNGFYRIRGYFYGQDMLVWFDDEKTIVLATNKVGSKDNDSNEVLMKKIYHLVNQDSQ